MKRQVYLIFNARGVNRISGTGKRGAITLPALRSGEFAVKIVLEIPDSLFRSEPPAATVVVPERAVLVPTVTVAEPEATP